jgi:ketopantoate reductase
MWVDLQKKRPTEIDFINGKLVKIGIMYGNLDVSLNMFFSTMVMTREIKSGVRKEESVPPYLGCEVRLCF